MNARLFEFLQKYGLASAAKLRDFPIHAPLYGTVFDDGNYEVVMEAFEKHFAIALPPGFEDKIKEEYRTSWKPTCRHFLKHPQKAPHRYCTALSIARLETVIANGVWSDADVSVIPKRDWML